jgi:type II secretory pathway pseudopilin PulG
METERRIEKLLRAFAKKRKADAGAPLELHPATRRLLQDEVARATKKTGRKGNSLWQILFASKPRLAFTLGVLAILGVSVSLLLPALSKSKSKGVLAENKRETAKELKQADMLALTIAPGTPAPASATAPVVPLADEKKFADREDLKAKADSTSGIDGVVPLAANTQVAVAANDYKGGFGGGGGGGGGRGGGARGGSSGLRKEAGGTPAANGTTAVVKSVEEKPATLAMSDTTETRRSKDSIMVAGGISSVNRDTGVVAPEVVTSPATPVLDSDQRASSTLAAAKAPTATTAPAGMTPNSVAGYAMGNGAVQFENADKTKLEQSRAQVATQKFYRLRLGNEINGAAEKQRTPLPRQSEATAGVVLDSFTVEQSGNQITVVDKDGSKYSGFIQLASVNDESISTVRQQPAAGAPAKVATAPQRRAFVATDTAAAVAPAGQSPTAAQNYFFRVTGTNRSLNQSVVFSGNLAENTNVVVARGGSFGFVTNALNAPQQMMPQLPLLNSRIAGRAAVGGKSEIEINAAPVSP